MNLLREPARCMPVQKTIVKKFRRIARWLNQRLIPIIKVITTMRAINKRTTTSTKVMCQYTITTTKDRMITMMIEKNTLRTKETLLIFQRITKFIRRIILPLMRKRACVMNRSSHIMTNP